MKIGDRVRVVSDRAYEGGREGIIVGVPANGDDWNVRIEHDPRHKTVGYTVSYRETSLEVMDEAVKAEPWFNDSIYVDNMLDKLVDALEQHTNALNRHSDLLASIFGK